MVGWSGAGSLENLERTAKNALGGVAMGTERLGEALLVETKDPVAVARRLAFLPGVSWISVGYRFTGTRNYLETLKALGKRYLSGGRTFSVSASVVRSRESAGDLVLEGNSTLLSAIQGTRVSERRPKVKFRVCAEGTRGACGVEIRVGPGGVPTSSQWVSCLVSGGERSSAMAWMSALSGFSLRLVHSRTGEIPLRQVARLYSELSFRIDPSSLELVVLDGSEGAVFGRIGQWLRKSKGPAFTGARSTPDVMIRLARAYPNLVSPLLLVQDEAVSATYRSLGIGREARAEDQEVFDERKLRASAPYSELRFGGIRADSNVVIDAVKKSAKTS